MKIVVVGAGVVGTALSEQLSHEGHQVALVDANRQLMREVGERYDVLGIVGNGTMPSVLHRAGIDDADMLIAVTNVDEVNLVVGMIASRFGVEHRVVRLRNREYVSDDVLSLNELGIQHIINPEPAIVSDIVRMVEIPGCNEYHPIGVEGQLVMLRFTVGSDSPSVGRKLAELRELAQLNAFLILYITRAERVFVPRGDDAIEEGDRLHILSSPDTVSLILPIIHKNPRPTAHVIVSGASRMGVELSQALSQQVKRVMLIARDSGRAEDAAAHLSKAMVLCGDSTHADVLEEAGVENCDLFCALSDDDQHNMLSALMAKKHGAKQTVVLVQHPDFVPILDTLGMETVINPRLVTVSEILTHVRRGQIHSVTRLVDSEAEIIELEVPPDCKAAHKPLRQLKFPKNSLVGAILRHGELRIPQGDTIIEPGDRVVIYALPNAIKKIEKLFDGP